MQEALSLLAQYPLIRIRRVFAIHDSVLWDVEFAPIGIDPKTQEFLDFMEKQRQAVEKRMLAALSIPREFFMDDLAVNRNFR